MAESKSKFRIKNGDVEIEYEGPVKDVHERYQEAFGWLKSSPRKEIKKSPLESEKRRVLEKKKGSRRPEIWSPAVADLIKENFFKLPNRRDLSAVSKKLADKALPVQGKDRVIKQTLTRKIRNGELKGTKGPEGWTFWTE